MGQLAAVLAEKSITAASRKTFSPPPDAAAAQRAMATSQAPAPGRAASPAAAAPGPADPYNLVPRTPGQIGQNRETWPMAFGNARGDTFLTAANSKVLIRMAWQKSVVPVISPFPSSILAFPVFPLLKDKRLPPISLKNAPALQSCFKARLSAESPFSSRMKSFRATPQVCAFVPQFLRLISKASKKRSWTRKSSLLR